MRWAFDLFFLHWIFCFIATAIAVGENENPGFYLSINPLAFTNPDGRIVKRRLQITWDGLEESSVSRIIVEISRDNEPVEISKHNEPILLIDPANTSEPFYVTDIVLEYPDLFELATSKCQFGIRAICIDNNETEVATACLRNEPEWQWDNKEVLSQMEIGSLMLIGAHDAAAYRDYQGEGDNNLVTQATFAQEEDLLSQLLWGVRFLDIRIGYYPSTEEKFWLVHGIIKAHPLQEGIDIVKQFLKMSRDVMVWEINGFEQNWTDEGHKELQELLRSEFYPWLVLPLGTGWSTKMTDIWDRVTLPEDEGRIIITYNEAHTDPVYFFPEVLERWGDVDEPEDLRTYLENQVAEATENPSKFSPWKPNCQLTPTAEDIIGGRWSGLREMADAVNRNVTKWWREDWSELTSTFPIHDFVLSTNMIAESIRRNVRNAEARCDN